MLSAVVGTAEPEGGHGRIEDVLKTNGVISIYGMRNSVEYQASRVCSVRCMDGIRVEGTFVICTRKHRILETDENGVVGELVPNRDRREVHVSVWIR